MTVLRVPGARVEYLDAGRGAPVVLLSGSAPAGAYWPEVGARLERRFRVMAPQCCGLGLELEAEIVCALVGRAGAPAHLVGEAHGAAVALQAARTRPDLLVSLTLIEPPAVQPLRDFALMTVPTLLLHRRSCPGDVRNLCQQLAAMLPDVRLTEVEDDAIGPLIEAHLGAY